MLIDLLRAQDWGSVPDWLGFGLALVLAVLAFAKRDSIGEWVARSVQATTTDAPHFEPWEVSEADPEWGGEPFRDAVWKLSKRRGSTYRLVNKSEWRARHIRFDIESPDIKIDSPVPETLDPGEWIEFRVDRAAEGHRVKRVYLWFQQPDGGIGFERFEVG